MEENSKSHTESERTWRWSAATCVWEGVWSGSSPKLDKGGGTDENKQRRDQGELSGSRDVRANALAHARIITLCDTGRQVGTHDNYLRCLLCEVLIRCVVMSFVRGP